MQLQIELAAVSGPQAKAIRLLRLTRIFAVELLGSLMIIPYGTQACTALAAATLTRSLTKLTELLSASTRRWPCMHPYRQTFQYLLLSAGATALRVHRSLQSRQHSSSKASVTICRDVPYGTRSRTVMDIYVPSQDPSPPKAAKAVQQATQQSNETARLSGSMTVHSARNNKQLPVALFCHGGVWATGV